MHECSASACLSESNSLMWVHGVSPLSAAVACLDDASDSRPLLQAQLLSSYILKPTLLYHVVPGVAAMVLAPVFVVRYRTMQGFWVFTCHYKHVIRKSFASTCTLW